VAILWSEEWHGALELAYRKAFHPSQPRPAHATLAALAPLYSKLDAGPASAHEASFAAAHGAQLQAARAHCEESIRAGGAGDAPLQAAWMLYYEVLRQLGAALQEARTLQLRDVSPRLAAARDLEIAVPGTYRANAPIVAIQSFAPTVRVMNSKQRPRKLAASGDDGAAYVFLLKGHEDLRQDERVMQLFGLVNTLLASTDASSRLDLGIQVGGSRGRRGASVDTV
jgi:FKBP12-rapamycin complex-associated protein